MLENFSIPDDPIIDEGEPSTSEDEHDLYDDLGSEYTDYESDFDPEEWN